ncbi:MAG: glycosyltransferase family 4 protein [Rhodocyclaceae bacterium]|nr:glycosyltransferase family 4 protein [Rhodocyclaceae bacterium]MDZ4215949.1 glycosyltransferase family 4 protein [Rhodocyclaceae bacterium]
MKLVQINLQAHFGGGEVFTAFLCRALSALGVATRLLVNPHADYWDRLDLPSDTELIKVGAGETAADHVPDGPVWLLAHGALPAELLKAAPRRLRTAIAHMPVQGRNPRAYDNHDLVFAVSGWVRDGLLAHDIPAWHEPLYGVADLSARGAPQPIRRTSRYDWDRRKGRDRLLGLIEPLIEPLRPHPLFERQRGLTLGIVSRLTPIKQFPLLFRHLAPVLAHHPEVRLEIFGSGGYASVRDLDVALKPCAGQVRFWGQQQEVASIYRQVDYLMTGLPEKEALGLNVIEAQACGTPVLAPHAPPFTETILDGETGFFYRDPRTDDGADFGRLIEELLSLPHPPDPRIAAQHLARFSFDAFVERIRPVVAWARTELGD